MSQKAAVIDDNKMNRERWGDLLLSIGYDPIIYNSITSLSFLENDLIEKKISYAMCDHRLNEANYAKFLGAKAVASLYDKKVSTLLITGWQNNDADTTIRYYRKKIPILLAPKEVNPVNIKNGFETVYKEVVENIIPPERQTCRTIMTVTDIIKKGNLEIVKVVMLQWNSNKEVGFPLKMLPVNLNGIVRSGLMILADVNIDAEKSEDLFFENFSLPNDEILETI